MNKNKSYEIYNYLKSIHNGESINVRKLKQGMGYIHNIDENGNTLLHILAGINTPVDSEVLVNTFRILCEELETINLTNKNGDIFYHILINNKNISEEDKKTILVNGKNNYLNINLANGSKETIFHLLVKNYPIYIVSGFISFLCTIGFNFNNNLLSKRELSYYLVNKTNYNENDRNYILEMIDMEREFGQEKYKNMKQNDSSSKINEDKKIEIDKDIVGLGTIMNEKMYFNEPAIKREQELRRIMVSLASEKKSPLIVGASGVGKTALVDELAYLIQEGKTPDFLRGKMIFESSVNMIVAGTRYRGDFEENMQKLMNFVVKNNGILFLDEIHTIFGAGATESDRTNDMSSIIKSYMDRLGLKIIGTTTDIEYNKYIANNPLKRRFEVIKVEEVNNEDLKEIIRDYLDKTGKIRQIFLDHIKEEYNSIINILIEGTSKNHRRYDDMLCNPDLAIGIIDKALAYAVCYDREYLEIEHFILAIRDNERIYDSAKDSMIRGLNYLDNNKGRENIKKKSLVINFKDYYKK